MANSSTISVFTLGCKTNLYESEQVVTALTNLGYKAFLGLKKADIFVINTCAVTAEAESKSRQAVARALKLNKNARILIMGCAGQKNPNQFISDNVTFISGNADKTVVAREILSKGINIEPFPNMYLDTVNATQELTRAFIKIQDGCNNFCSYCIVPYLRGRSRSRQIDSIVNEIKSNDFAKEFVLLGIDISQYGLDINANLPTLLNSLSFVNGRIRLGSIYQDVITDEFLTSLSTNVCKHLHLSMQSGCDKVLHDMNRHYNTQEFFNSIEKARKYYPNIGITTDIIVGFPTETEEDFVSTCEFVKKVAFSDIHIFPYSPREGTTAYKLGKLPKNVVTNRVKRLTEIKYQLKNAFIEKFIGKQVEVLVEEYKDGYFVGYTDNYVRIYIKDKVKINTFALVTISEIFKEGALATL